MNLNWELNSKKSFLTRNYISLQFNYNKDCHYKINDEQFFTSNNFNWANVVSLFLDWQGQENEAKVGKKWKNKVYWKNILSYSMLFKILQ